MKKSIMLAMLLLTQSIVTMAATGSITNNANGSINIVFYKAYVAPTTGTNTTLGRSAQGRSSNSTQGTVITAGQNYNMPPDATSMDVFYGNGTLPPLHAQVSTGLNYTVNPGAQWTITQD